MNNLSSIFKKKKNLFKMAGKKLKRYKLHVMPTDIFTTVFGII